MPASPRASTRSRAVPTAYGVASVVMLLVVATLSLVVTPPGPPALAEFAPRAEDRIDEALKAQSSSFGSGEGGACAGGQDCAAGEGGAGATTTTVAVKAEGDDEPIDGRAVRRCVGDPPRQTEDPQSPPCLNYWKGDNGGATSKGVTAHEVRVAVPESSKQAFDGLVGHFNRRYEFYGRKIVPVYMPRTTGTFDTLAVTADEEAKAFAVLPYYNGPDLDVSSFQEEAARRKLISILAWTTHAPASAYRDLAPYAWNYAPTSDEAQSATADLVCSSLAGRQARYAGPNQRLDTRRFAVLASNADDRQLDVTLFKQAVARCGVGGLPVFTIRRGESREEKINKWRAIQGTGATSLIVFASAYDYTQWTASYRPAEYEPELVVGGMGVHESEAQWMTAGKAEDRARLFGVWAQNKLLPPSDTPAYWARIDATGSADPLTAANDYFPYQQLLLLASGIQWAGPRLTPETFAAGLQRIRFPNPGADTAPFYQARVGFGPGDFAMTDTFAAGWFSDAAPSYMGPPLSNRGGWCYVRFGRRFPRGAWPALGDEFFDPDPRNCR